MLEVHTYFTGTLSTAEIEKIIFSSTEYSTSSNVRESKVCVFLSLYRIIILLMRFLYISGVNTCHVKSECEFAVFGGRSLLWILLAFFV